MSFYVLKANVCLLLGSAPPHCVTLTTQITCLGFETMKVTEAYWIDLSRTLMLVAFNSEFLHFRL